MEASSEIGFLDETHFSHLSPSSNDPLSWVITYRFPSFLSIPFPFLPLPNHSLPTFTGRINENTIESETRTKYKERPETFPSVINQSINRPINSYCYLFLSLSFSLILLLFLIRIETGFPTKGYDDDKIRRVISAFEWYVNQTNKRYQIWFIHLHITCNNIILYYINTIRLGIFSTTKEVSKQNSYLDTFCEILKEKLQYEHFERDMILLHHIFGVEWADGKRVFIHILSYSSHLYRY